MNGRRRFSALILRGGRSVILTGVRAQSLHRF